MLTERPDFHNKHQTQIISKPLIQILHKHLPRLTIPSVNKNHSSQIHVQPMHLYAQKQSHEHSVWDFDPQSFKLRPWRPRERESEIKIREERKRAGFRDATTIGTGGDTSLKLSYVSHKLQFRER